MTDKSHLLTGHWSAVKLAEVGLEVPFRSAIPGTKVLSELVWTKQKRMESGPYLDQWLVHAAGNPKIADFRKEDETVYVEEVAL